jgi:hypothetical protein
MMPEMSMALFQVNGATISSIVLFSVYSRKFIIIKEKIRAANGNLSPGPPKKRRAV